ncbi:hypothetical protein [uncultured Vagococcus sp.]|uniref:hypothetical protein n=1 Tax=uncultured Vagococcus sp. TaxID=189676 RepID=UPI0028D3D96B|nr:hypothetical protein [uncultured Vagococcus sp.]
MEAVNQLAGEIKETMATIVATLEAELVKKDHQICQLEGAIDAQKKTLDQANLYISELEATIEELISENQSPVQIASGE